MTADPRPRRSYRVLLLGVVAALAGAHVASACGSNCSGGECTSTSDALLINRVCGRSFHEGPACELGDGAVKSTGITGDTIGFHLGDQGGTLIFHLEALEGVRRGTTFDVEILAAATIAEGSQMETNLTWGSCGQGCPEDPNTFVSSAIPPEYKWFSVVIGQFSATAPSLPYDAVLELTGKSIDIADIRVSSISSEFSCCGSSRVGAL